mmetsp:Transcript_38693/g.120334  ORF Transcript_38693/g.120334 Transcript_38693/m.120334 type:complete len:437 (-) Transcript_38693:98-1408(-)
MVRLAPLRWHLSARFRLILLMMAAGTVGRTCWPARASWVPRGYHPPAEVWLGPINMQSRCPPALGQRGYHQATARVCLGLSSSGAPGRRTCRGPGPRAGRHATASSEELVGVVGPARAREWWFQFIILLVSGVVFWTALDCALDPNMEYPFGPLRVAAPTSLLVATGAGVGACTRLPSLPCGLEDARKAERVCAVFVGDSLTHGSLSANFLELLSQEHGGQGEFVNCGMNMRPSGDLLDGSLLEDAARLEASRGVVVLIGTNDLIRYTAVPAVFRQSLSDWLRDYSQRMGEIVRKLQRCGAEVTVASPPLLGEDPDSDEGRLGLHMAEAVRKVSATADRPCRYVPLYETTVEHLRSSTAAGSSAPGSRAYSLLESLVLLTVLPWRLYGARKPLAAVQAEHGLDLTVDLVHFGPRFGRLAADLFSEALDLRESGGDQ